MSEMWRGEDDLEAERVWFLHRVYGFPEVSVYCAGFSCVGSEGGSGVGVACGRVDDGRGVAASCS